MKRKNYFIRCFTEEQVIEGVKRIKCVLMPSGYKDIVGNTENGEYFIIIVGAHPKCDINDFAMWIKQFAPYVIMYYSEF